MLRSPFKSKAMVGLTLVQESLIKELKLESTLGKMGCNGQWWVSQGGFDETLNTDWKLNNASTQDSFEYNAGIDHMGNDHFVCQLFVMELSWWEVTLPSRERTERGENSPYQKWCWSIYRVQGLGLQWLYISQTGHRSLSARDLWKVLLQFLSIWLLKG